MCRGIEYHEFEILPIEAFFALVCHSQSFLKVLFSKPEPKTVNKYSKKMEITLAIIRHPDRDHEVRRQRYREAS